MESADMRVPADSDRKEGGRKADARPPVVSGRKGERGGRARPGPWPGC